MSYENQPIPILPNYNPSAWETPLSAEEQEVLDAHYIKFPIAQNAPITFPSITTIGTVKTNTISSTATNGELTIGTDQTSAGKITLGNTTNGTITVNRPITIGYPISSSLSNLGGYKNATFNGEVDGVLVVYDLSTSSKGFSPINSVPNGFYQANMSVTINTVDSGSAVFYLTLLLITSTNPIVNGLAPSPANLANIFAGKNVGYKYVIYPNQEFTISLAANVEINSSSNNVGILLYSDFTSNNVKTSLTLVRLS